MKQITSTLLIVLIGSVIIFAQVPHAFKYQTVVRDDSGNIITNQPVSFRIGILQDSVNGTQVYSETHNVTTNEVGHASLEIGTGTIESGVFGDIGWGTSLQFLKLELDETGNANYQLMGTSQLLAVPYALQAENVTNDKDGQIFSVSGDTLFITNGNYVILPGVSPTIPFKVCGDVLTDIDWNAYNTVQIVTQCWMKENLKTTTYNNGTPILYVTNGTHWANLSSGAYSWKSNDITFKDKYGALYNWYAVDDPNGLCPEGWHVPSDSDWTTLTDYIGGTGPPHGNELKSCRQVNSPLAGNCNTTEHPRWDEDTQNGNYGTDDYGFSGLPGGTRSHLNGVFSLYGERGYWWTSTTTSVGTTVWTRALIYEYSIVSLSNSHKNNGSSVRCLQD